MSRCPDCRSRGECEDWCGSDSQELWEEIESLKAQLEEAKNDISEKDGLLYNNKLYHESQEKTLEVLKLCVESLEDADRKQKQELEATKKELELERESRSIAIIEEKADAYELFVVDCRHWSLDDLQRMYRDKAIGHRATVERARARVRERG